MGSLDAFVSSQEARTLRVVAKEPSGHDQGPPIRSFGSRGSRWLASYTSKSGGLKTFLGPYDWIFSSLPMEIEWNSNNLEDYGSLVRCAERFRRILESPERNILFRAVADFRGSEADIARLCDILDERGAGAEAHVIWLSSAKDPLGFSFATAVAKGRHRLYTMQPTSPPGGLRFEAAFGIYVLIWFLDNFA